MMKKREIVPLVARRSQLDRGYGPGDVEQWLVGYVECLWLLRGKRKDTSTSYSGSRFAVR